MSYMPWMPTEGNEGAIARREMLLPPEIQMQGHMQSLRDAILATMLLHEIATPTDGTPWQALEGLRLRQNERAKMLRRVKFLKERTAPETYEKCRVAAVKLHTIEVVRYKQERLKHFKPDTSRQISDRAYAAYWNKARKEREASKRGTTAAPLELDELRFESADGE